jgi:glycosyltransferase involved in cell wall biosynthesis
MYRPVVSVITPTYNRSHLLPRVWRSLQRQTLQDFEWIIVDDGSLDDTKSVVAAFNDPRICYIFQENLGPTLARARGEQEAQGEFVIFLDSDDELYAEDTLEMMVKTIKQAPPRIGMVYFTCVDSRNMKEVAYVESDIIEVDYIDHVCEKRFRGEFFAIYRREILALAPWPPKPPEVLRHWRLARHCQALVVRRPARIYHRSEVSRITSPLSAISRAPTMALNLKQLIEEHRDAWLAHCPCQLGRYLFYVSMYQALAGYTKDSLKTAISAWPTATWGVRAKIGFLVASLILPTRLRQAAFVWLGRIRGQ